MRSVYVSNLESLGLVVRIGTPEEVEGELIPWGQVEAPWLDGQIVYQGPMDHRFDSFSWGFTQSAWVMDRKPGYRGALA